MIRHAVALASRLERFTCVYAASKLGSRFRCRYTVPVAWLKHAVMPSFRFGCGGSGSRRPPGIRASIQGAADGEPERRLSQVSVARDGPKAAAKRGVRASRARLEGDVVGQRQPIGDLRDDLVRFETITCAVKDRTCDGALSSMTA
jgi:hypothetical protein